MKTNGWITGGTLVGGGTIMLILSMSGAFGDYDYDFWDGPSWGYTLGGVAIAAGLGTGIPLICIGQKKINQSLSIQSTAFYQFDIPLNSNAKLTADVNLIKDNLTRQYAPGLGFHINF